MTRIRTNRGIRTLKKKGVKITVSKKKQKKANPVVQKMSSRRLVTAFPKRCVQKMRLSDTAIFSSATDGSPASVSYCANSAYDFFRTGTPNHQPLYFDELAAIYGRYKVLNSKITIHYNNVSLASAHPLLSIHLKDEVGSISVQRAQMEDKRSAFRFISSDQQAGGRTSGKLSLSYSDKAWWGDNDINRDAPVTEDPTDDAKTTPQCYYNITISNVKNTAQCSVVAVIVADLLVEFTDPIDPPVS